MSAFQKIIKYCAIAFGLYLALTIIGSIIIAIVSVFGITLGIASYDNYTNVSNNKGSSYFSQTYTNVENLDIDLNVSKLSIESGPEFKVTADNTSNGFYCNLDNSTLTIHDAKNQFDLFYSDDHAPQITIYLPENQKFDNVNIKTGINKTVLENIDSNTINLETGVGTYTIYNLTADNAKIKGGAGKTTINDSKFNDLSLDTGVGDFSINTQVNDRAKIDAGVGNLKINLRGNKDNYKIKSSTGLGNLSVDGDKASDGEVFGNGKADIDITAGVGNVKVNFNNNQN